MSRKWMILGAAALLLTAGCGKSGNNANQTAANTPNSAADATNQAAPGQNPPQGQANPGTTAAPVPPPEPPQPFGIVAGTPLPVILTSQLDSRVNQVGETFQGSLAAPILVAGEEAIPKGAAVTGEIVNAKKQGAVKGEATLAVRLTSLTVRGKTYPIASSTYAATQKGKGKRSAALTGGGAVVGALIGGLAGGGKGAAIGAGVGGGGGLAASAGTGGQNVVFPAESRITFKLSHDLTVDR
jgi:hypothetical protein